LQQIQNGPDNKWCHNNGRYQVCSDNKEKLMSTKEEDKESKEPDYNDDKDHLEEQEEETGELNEQESTTNNVF